MTVLAAMLDVENRREVKTGDHKIKTSAGLLSEKFGSGKTFMVLALIMKSPMPANRPIYQKINTYNGQNSFTVKKTFSEETTLRPALIFVASSVLLQWEHVIKSMTNLKVFTVTNVFKVNNVWKMSDIRGI